MDQELWNFRDLEKNLLDGASSHDEALFSVDEIPSEENTSS